MDEFIIRPMGGFTGEYISNTQSERRISMSALSLEDRAKIDLLFSNPATPPSNFYYHLTRRGPMGTKTVVVQPDALPAAVISSLKTDLK